MDIKPPPGFTLKSQPEQPDIVVPKGFVLKKTAPEEQLPGQLAFGDEQTPVGDPSTWESFKTNFGLAKDNIEKSTWEGLQNAARHEPGLESIGGVIQSAAEKLGDPDFFEKRILDNEIDIQAASKKLVNESHSGLINFSDAVMNPHDFWGRQLGETLGGMAGLIAMPLVGGVAATAAVAGVTAAAGVTSPAWMTALIAGIGATAASRPFESSAEAQQTYLDIKENLKKNQATNKLTDQQIDAKAYEGFNQTFSDNQQLQIIDAAQIALSIIPLGRLIKPLAKGRSIGARAAERVAIWSKNNAGKEIAVKTGLDMIQEGWEEGRQEQIQREAFNAQVNPEDAKPSSWIDLWNDPTAFSQMQGGAIGGLFMGGGLSTLGHFADKVGIMGKQAEKFTEAEIKDKQKHMRGFLVAKAIVMDTELDLKAAVDKYAKTGLLAPDPKASKEERIKESVKEGKNIIKEFEEHYDRFSLLQKVKKGVKDQDNLIRAYKNEMYIETLNDEITKLGGAIKEKEAVPGEEKKLIPHEKDIKERMGIIEKLQEENERIYNGEDVIAKDKQKLADEVKAAAKKATTAQAPPTKTGPVPVAKEPEETKVSGTGAPTITTESPEVKPVAGQADDVKVNPIAPSGSPEIKDLSQKEGALESLKGKAVKGKADLDKLTIQEEENDAILKDLSKHVDPDKVFKDDVYADDNSDFVKKVVESGKAKGAEENDAAFARNFKVHSEIKSYGAPMSEHQATTINNLKKIRALSDKEIKGNTTIGKASKVIQLGLRRLYYAREEALKKGTPESIQQAEDYQELIKHINKVDTLAERKKLATFNTTVHDKVKQAESADQATLQNVITDLSDAAESMDKQRTVLAKTGKKRDLIKADLYSEYLDTYDNALIYLQEVYKERFGEFKEAKKEPEKEKQQSVTDPISDEDYKDFKDPAKKRVSEDILKSIAGKTELSPREKEIYAEFKQEIEEIKNESGIKVGLTASPQLIKKGIRLGFTKDQIEDMTKDERELIATATSKDDVKELLLKYNPVKEKKVKKQKSEPKKKRPAYKSPTQKEIQDSSDEILEKHALDIQKEIQERTQEGVKTKLLSNVLARIQAEQQKRKSKKVKPEKKKYTRDGEKNFRDLLDKAKAKLNKKGAESLSFAIFRDLMHMALTTKLSAQDGIEMLDAWIGIAEKEFPQNAPTKLQVESALYVFNSEAYPALQRLKVPFDVRSTEYDFSKFLIGRKGLLGKLDVAIYETRLKQAASDKKARQGKLFMNGVNFALFEKYAWKLAEQILEGTITVKNALKQLNDFLLSYKKQDGSVLSQMEHAVLKSSPEYNKIVNHIQEAAHTVEVDNRKKAREAKEKRKEAQGIDEIDSENKVADVTDQDKATAAELAQKGKNYEDKAEAVKSQIKEIYTTDKAGKLAEIHDADGYIIPQRVISRVLENFAHTIKEEKDLLTQYSNIPGEPEISKFIEENATEAGLWSLHNYLKSVQKVDFVYITDLYNKEESKRYLSIMSSNESLSFDDSAIGMTRTFDRFIQKPDYEEIFKKNAQLLRDKYYKVVNDLRSIKSNEEKEALVKRYFQTTAILLNRITGIDKENFYYYMMEDKKMSKEAAPHANGAIKFYKNNGNSNVAKFLFSDFNGLTKSKDFIDRMVKPGKGGFPQISDIEKAVKKNKKVMVDRFKGVTKKQKSSDILVSRFSNELKKLIDKKTQAGKRAAKNPWVRLFQHRPPKWVLIDGYKNDITKEAEEAKSLSPDTMFLINLTMFMNNENKVPAGRYLQRYEQQADESSKIFLEAQKYSTQEAKALYEQLKKDTPKHSIPSIAKIEADVEAYKSRYFGIQRKDSAKVNFKGATANQVIEQWVWNFVVNKFMQDQYINPEFNDNGKPNWVSYLADKVKRKDTANGVQLNFDYLRSVYEEREGVKLSEDDKNKVLNMAIINDPIVDVMLSEVAQFLGIKHTDGLVLMNPTTARHIAVASGSILNYDQQIKSHYSHLDEHNSKVVIKGNTVVLTPELVATFSEMDEKGNDVSPLAKFLDWMEKHNIDQIAFLSTAKQKQPEQVTKIPWNIKEDNTYNILEDLPDPTIIRMDIENYVVQQDLRNKDYLHLRKDVRQRHYFNMQYKQGEAIQKLFNQAIELYAKHVSKSFQEVTDEVKKGAKTSLYNFIKKAEEDGRIKFADEKQRHSLVGNIIANENQKTELGKELRSQYDQELARTADSHFEDKKRAWILKKIKDTKANEAIREYIKSGKSLKAPYIEDAVNNVFKNVVEEEILGLRIFGASAVTEPNYGNKLKTIRLSKDKKQILPGQAIVPAGFKKTHKVGEWVFVTRVPSTGAHSTALVQIKDFMPESAGNRMVTDAGTQQITGEDFDGDARYIWGKFKDKEGNEIKDDTWRGIMNKAFDLNVEIYKDPKNFDSLIRPIDTKKSAAHIQAQKQKDESQLNPYLPSSLEKADNVNGEGSTVISILARNQAAYAFIKKMGGHLAAPISYMRKGKDGELEVVEGSNKLSHDVDTQNILDAEMSNNLNHATDNGKDNNLAYLGLLKSMATFKTYLLAIGVDPETATMYCNHPVMREYIKVYAENRAPYNMNKGSVFNIVAETILPGSTKSGKVFDRAMKRSEKNIILTNRKILQAKNLSDLTPIQNIEMLKWFQYNMKNAGDFYKISEMITVNEDGIRNFAELYRASKIIKEFTKPGTNITLPGVETSEFFKPALINIRITATYLQHQIAYSTKAQKIFETVLDNLGSQDYREESLVAITNGIKNYITTEALNITETTDALKEKAKYFYDTIPAGSILTKYLGMDLNTGQLSLITAHRRTKLEKAELDTIKTALKEHLDTIKDVVTPRDLMAYHYRIFGLGDATALYGGFSHMFTDEMVDDLGKKIEKMQTTWVQHPFKDVVDNIAGQVFSKMPEEWETVEVISNGKYFAMIDDFSDDQSVKLAGLPMFAYTYLNDTKTVLKRVETKNGQYFEIDEDKTKQANRSGSSVEFKLNYKPIIDDTITPKIGVSSEKINIYAGTNENAELSNFAIRPFTPNFSEEVFNTVEGAFQAAKLQYTYSYLRSSRNLIGEDSKIIKKLQTATGDAAKVIGGNIKELNIEEWDKNSLSIMKELLIDSFKQNPEALKKLLATGNAELTHTQDKSKWGKEFPRLLMEVRDELKNNIKSVEDVKAEEVTPQAVKEALKNVPIPQKYIHGGLSVDKKHRTLLREDVWYALKAAGYSTKSSANAIRAGIRTRTTRARTWLNTYNVFTVAQARTKFEGKLWPMVDEKGNKMLTRITKVYANTESTWDKEGWVPSEFEFVKDFPVAIEFEYLGEIDKDGVFVPKTTTEDNTNIKYQESSTENPATSDRELNEFIQQKLAQLYPDVKVFNDPKAFQEYIDKNFPGQKVISNALGAAIGDAVFIDPDKAVQSTAIHEHAHLYWDALPANDRTKIALLKMFGTEEKAIQAIGEAGVSLSKSELDSSKYNRFINLLKMFWSKVKAMFGVANEKDLAKIFAKRVLTNKDKIQVGGSREIKHQLDTNRLGPEQKKTANSLNKIYRKLINAEGKIHESPQNSELVGVKTVIKNHRGEIDTSTPEELKANVNIIWGEVFDDIATQITSGVARKDITQKPDKPVVPDKILDTLYQDINKHIESLKKSDIDIPVAQIPVGSNDLKAIGFIDIGIIHDNGKMTIRDFKASQKSKVEDSYKGVKKEDDTMQQIIYKIMLEKEDTYYGNSPIDVESIGIVPINYTLDESGNLVSAILEPEVLLKSTSYEINTGYEILRSNADRVLTGALEHLDTKSILTIEQYVAETENISFQGLKDQLKALTANLRKEPEPGESAAAVRKKNGMTIKQIAGINKKIGKFVNKYNKYRSDLMKVNDLMNKDLDAMSIEELEEMHELINSYDNLAAGIIFSHGEKGISVAIMNALAKKQAAETGVSHDIKRDLGAMDDMFLAISDMRDYLPAHQLMSRRYLAATTAAEMEYQRALDELTPLAKKVIQENSKNIDRWTKIKNTSSIPFVSSKSNEIYFANEYKPDGTYRNPDETVAPYKKGSKTERMDSLTDAEKEHLRAVLKWTSSYRDQQNLALDMYTQRKYADFQAVHISKSFAENLASGKNGIYKAFSNWMSSGKDIHQIKLSYQDPRNSSSPRVLRSYSDIINDLDKAYGDGFISNVMKSIKLFFYMRKAMKAMDVGFHEDITGGFDRKNPITDKEVHFSYKIVEGKVVQKPNTMGSKRTMNVKKQLITTHNFKESENAEFTYDTHRAVMKYIADMAYVKHVNPLVPTITSLQAIEQIRGNRPNLTKWMDNFVSTDLLQENKITFGRNPDAVLSVLRAITYYSIMTFNIPLGVFNILTGTAGTIINRGPKQWYRGAKLMTNPKEWKRANGILKHYTVVSFKDEPNPDVKAGDVIEFLAIGLIKHGERFIQGSAFLGDLPKEVYDNFDKDGNIIDQSKELSFDEIVRRKIAVSDVQGKYSEFNKRFYRANAGWAFVMQFKTWFPDYLNTLIKGKQKNIYAQDEKGYIIGLKDVMLHTYQKHWEKTATGPLTAEQKADREKAFRAMVILASLFSLWAMSNGDDDDKEQANLVMKLIDQVFGFLNPMSFVDMAIAPGLGTAKNILSAMGSIFSVYKRDNAWGKEGDWKFLDQATRVIPYNKAFTAEPIGLLRNDDYGE